MRKIIGFLRLMRPANIVTAISDILAGVAIAGYSSFLLESPYPVGWLILATSCLYGGGVVFNDVFDADLDKVERPERPIPSGLISVAQGARFGAFLLAAGIVAAFMVSNLSGILAVTIATAALVYDKWGKHHVFLGPLNMGLCRGLNLLLGISIVPMILEEYWWLAAIPVLYIAPITMISRGEVHGGSRSTLYGAAGLYVIVMGSIMYVSFMRETLIPTSVFILFWAGLIFPPLRTAIRNPEGRFIGKAVKIGVLALIVMNAAWAAAFGAFYVALITVLLLPISMLLARVFAVT